MKNLILIISLILSVNQIQAQKSKTVSEFKVEGNCEMCKTRIEKAAKSVKGVLKANWNIKSKTLKVTFNSSVASLDEIHQSISNMGYKTEKLAASKKGYDVLPFCCKVTGACKDPERN